MAQQMLITDVLGGIFVELGSIVDDTYRPAKRRRAVRHELGDLGLDGQVRLQRNRPASERGDFGDHLVRFGLRFPVMDGDVPAPAGKAKREGAADPPGGAGDQHDPRDGGRTGVDCGSIGGDGHLQYADESESSPTR
jgi:hypothetical protein